MDWELDDRPLGDMDLAERIVWTWVVEVWPEGQPPPWTDDASYEAAHRSELPVTWVARETIHVGYEP